MGATLQLLGHTCQVPLTVQNLQFQARVRAAAQVSTVRYRQHAGMCVGSTLCLASTQHLRSQSGPGLDLKASPKNITPVLACAVGFLRMS